MNQIIIHVDMDAFFASVEIRDNPALKDKPLIIGALPGERGVVATCSYEARKYGVHSAMNIKEAFRLCPHGIFMHPNFDKYKETSHRLHEIWNTYATASQTIALDEAYLDVTERAVTWEGAREIGHLIKRRTLEEVGLTCSVGVAYSKTAAKMASEEKKPDGYFEITTPEDFVRLIIDRDVSVLYTVGDATAGKLHAAGIHTVRDIRERSAEVVRLLGKVGNWITQVAQGIDERKVVPYRPEDAKSIGREVTFQRDVIDYDLLKDILLLLSLCVEHRAKRVGLRGRGVTLKITYGNMKSISRSRGMTDTRSAIDIYHEALRMLERVTHHPVRLIGVSIYNLTGDKSRQLYLEELFEDAFPSREQETQRLLVGLQERYHLDFAGHLTQIYHSDTLHRTVEYMRRHFVPQH